MPFLHHLEELRRTLLQIAIAVGVGAVVAWVASDPVLNWLIEHTSGTAIFTRPQGAFMARFKVSLVLGILITLPFGFYKAWSFIGPGLLDTERKVVLPGALMSATLFYLGVLFSYFLLTPITVKALIGFGSDRLTAQTEINYLLDLVFAMGLACGLVFQLPLILGFLTLIGIVTPAFLRRYWRHSVVIIFIAAAVLTPADPFSQIILAVPLLVLYVISYFLCAAIHRGRRRRAREASDAPGD